MFSFLKKLVLSLFVLLVVLLGGTVYTLKKVIEEDKIRPELEKIFSEFLRRDLTIDHLGFRVFPMPVLVGYEVTLTDRDQTILAQSPEVEIRISLETLKKRKLILNKIHLIRPQATLRRLPTGQFPAMLMVDDIRQNLRRKDRDPNRKPSPYVFERISLDKGFLRLRDESLAKPDLDTTFSVNAYGDIQG